MSLTINPVSRQENNVSWLCDERLAGTILPQWLDYEYWQRQAAVSSAQQGRGSAWFVSADGNDYVLRHYRRGGAIARISQDRYLWLGLEATRAWREWRLLARMHNQALPVPEPIAARVIRCGWFYRADILTRRIPDCRTLAEYLQHQPLEPSAWAQIGATIGRFHRHDIYHADLNAHNILLNASQQPFLIDFDKGGLKTGQRWKTANLRRLHRSLKKLQGQSAVFYFSAQDWMALQHAYLHH